METSTEGSRQPGGQPTSTLTPDGAVARPSTNTVTTTVGSRQQVGQSTSTLTPDGAVARPSTDTVVATEGSQQQQGQSFSTSTTTHNCYGLVSQYAMSNSSNIAVGDDGYRGCISQESLRIRINQVSECKVVQTCALHKAEELLKIHSHVAICGAPGDGKTTSALKICETYMKKIYQVLFVENIEEFDIDVVIKRKCDMLVVFDDIFGSVALPRSLEKLHKVCNALVDILLIRDEELAAKEERKKKADKKDRMKNVNKDMKKEDEKKCDDEETTKTCNYKLCFIFTSRNYN